ncbi:MAG: PDZ domain-containing protein [Gemmatimonadota bacterium]
MVLSGRAPLRVLGVVGLLLAPAAGLPTARAQEPAQAPRAATPPTSAGRAYSGAAAAFAEVASTQQDQSGWLGIGLSCSDCSIRSTGKTVRRWTFSRPPLVYSVDQGGPADRAGLRPGDTLIAIDGQEFVSREGGEAFANLISGERVRLTYARGGRRRTVAVVPVDRPAPTAVADIERTYSEAFRDAARAGNLEAERARRELTRLQAELGRNRGKLLDSASSRRIQESLELLQRSLRAMPERGLVPPSIPLPPMVFAPGVPTPPTVSSSSGLRYSGRLGNTVIEARRPGGVSITETGDSVVMLTGGDLMVRIALEGGRFTVTRGGTAIPVGAGTVRSSGGDVTYGITGYLVNPRLGEALGTRAGILALDVAAGSHADSLGIVPGDVVVELNDRAVVAITPAQPFGGRILRGVTPPQPGALSAVVVRGGERRTLRLATAPATPRARLLTPPSRAPATPAPPRRP